MADSNVTPLRHLVHCDDCNNTLMFLFMVSGSSFALECAECGKELTGMEHRILPADAEDWEDE